MLNTNRLVLKNDNLRESIINFVKCNLCKNILNDPYDCICCNLTYCYSCIGEYIIKNKKCPNKITDETPEEDSECKLKPSTLNLNNFISSLNFSCSNKFNGCNEELEYNNIILHELCCPFGKLENARDSFHRTSSIVSFKNKNENNSVILESNKSSEQNLNEKLDKIMDQLNHINTSMIELNRLNICPPVNDFVTETPKFSIGFNSRHDSASYMRNKFSFSNEKINFNNNTFYNHNINTIMEQQKICNELELLNEKITNFESKMDSLCEDKFIKKIEEKCLTNLLSKLNENVNSRNRGTTSAYSSFNQNYVNYTTTMKSTKISPQNSPPKENTIKKRETKTKMGSPPAIKKIMIKNKVDSKANLVSSPTKNNSPPKDNLKHSNNKIISACFEKENNNTENFDFLQTQTKFDEINETLKTILNRMDLNMKTINISYDMNKEQIKEYLHSDFTKELKNCFLEITLDSYNVYVEKIEEMFKRLN